MKSSIKLQFSSKEYKLKATFTFIKSADGMFLPLFMLTYNNVV